MKRYQGKIYLCMDQTILKEIYKKMGRPAIEIKRDRLHWYPYKFKFDDTN